MLPVCFAGMLSVAHAAGVLGISAEEPPIGPPLPPDEDVVSGTLHLDFNGHFYEGSSGPALLLESGSNSLSFVTFDLTEEVWLSFRSSNIPEGGSLFSLRRDDSWHRFFSGETEVMLLPGTYTLDGGSLIGVTTDQEIDPNLQSPSVWIQFSAVPEPTFCLMFAISATVSLLRRGNRP